MRGINLGSHNKVSMPALRAALTAAGFEDVRTYVNSGNVIVRSNHTKPDDVSAAVRRVVAECSDVDTPVLVRTYDQLAAILAWNPFPDAAASRPNLVMVLHLDAEPTPERVRDLLDANVAPDEIAARGREVVVAYEKSSQRSPTEKPLKRLGVTMTARNWRTLTALARLAAG